MSQQKRKRNPKKKYYHEQTTFDPKIHIKTGSGYHMKPNAPKVDLSGKQLSHILDPK